MEEIRENKRKRCLMGKKSNKERNKRKEPDPQETRHEKGKFYPEMRTKEVKRGQNRKIHPEEHHRRTNYRTE